MKRIILTLFALYACRYLNAQQILVRNDMMENRLYLGVENTLDIMVEGKKCGSFFVTTDNGKIFRDGCQYRMVPKQLGMATIFIKQTKGKDTATLKTYKTSVTGLPLPEASIGSQIGGPIKKQELISRAGLIARLYCCGFDAPVKVLSYKIVAIRKKEVVFVSDNIGNRYSEETKSLLEKLEVGDEVYVTNIWVIPPDGLRTRIKACEFVIE
jgi:gliding motility-associated GldM-like protein